MLRRSAEDWPQTADAFRDWKRLQAVADEAEKNFAPAGSGTRRTQT